MNPEILIKEGMTIGYRPRRFQGREGALRLASAKTDIELKTGRHLLLARNGRGKTTLLKTLAGLLPVMGGEFKIEGQRQFIDEELRFDQELTPRQIFRSFFPNGRFDLAMEMSGRLELDVKKQYGKLSKGNRQKVTLIVAECQAAGGGAQVMLLDEPFSGLDFHVREKIDEIWNERGSEVLRLVCVHPDEPTLQADSALVISEEIMEQVKVDGMLDWFETRKSLN